jgi:hypothetical protein
MNGIDNYGVKGRIADFDQRNGGNPVYFKEWFYYENGAQREGWPLGVLLDPPKDEYQLATNILQYHKARHAIAAHTFENFKEQLGMSGCPDREGLDELRKLHGIVGERNQAVTDARARLAETETGKRLASSRQTDAEQQQEMKNFRDELKTIRI